MSNNHTLFHSSSPFVVKSRNDKFTIQLSIKNKKDSAYNTRALVQYSPNIIFAGIEVGIFHISRNLLLGRSEEVFVSRQFHCSDIISVDCKRFIESAVLAYTSKRMHLF